VDGIWLHDFSANGGLSELQPSDAGVQEYVYETSAISAETMSGGIRVNIVPKEGGNVFNGSASFNGSTGALASNNLSDVLATRAEKLDRVWDVNAGLGGPLMQDRLWFFGTFRHWGLHTYPPGAISEANPTKPFRADERYMDTGMRLTWQASLRNKINAYFSNNLRDRYSQELSATTTAEAAIWSPYLTMWVPRMKWTNHDPTRMIYDPGVKAEVVLSCHEPAALRSRRESPQERDRLLRAPAQQTRGLSDSGCQYRPANRRQ
jgi:hypothetical protein